MKLLNVLLKLFFTVPGDMEKKIRIQQTLLIEFKFKSKIFWVDGEQSKLWFFSKQPFIGFVQIKMF